jgi:hypothetical protein
MVFKRNYQVSTTMNLRKVNRYLLRCPAQYEWVSSAGLQENGSGLTRDLSVAGVFVQGDRSPPVGTEIKLAIALPNCEDTRYGMRLHGVGKVLRVEQERELHTCGFAVGVRLNISAT